MLILTGCETTGKQPVSRNLPGPPSDCRPGAELPHKVGDDAKVALKKEREENRRLNKLIQKRCRNPWHTMRRRYKAG